MGHAGRHPRGTQQLGGRREALEARGQAGQPDLTEVPSLRGAARIYAGRYEKIGPVLAELQDNTVGLHRPDDLLQDRDALLRHMAADV